VTGMMIRNKRRRGIVLEIRRLLKKTFPKAAGYYRGKVLLRQANRLLIKNKESFLYLTGWMRSQSEGKPVDGAGNHIPWIDWSLVKGNSCKITVFPKGGGSENGSALKMFNPTVDLDEIKKFIVEHVIEMGGRVCPPTVVGIGIGGGSDIALKLAKKSLLRPIGDRNKNKTIAKLEIDLLEEINDTGIGPMGLGGDTTALDVHIEVAHRHPASFPVGIAMQCWANRRASIIITRDGEIIW